MDLRIQKTERNIINAFIEIRATKPLEKITVKELAEKAMINKATFYQHYQDIYALSNKLERDTLKAITDAIIHPEYVFSNPKQGYIEISTAILAQSQMIDILFGDSRRPLIKDRLSSSLKELFYKNFPKYKGSLEADIIMTVLIQGLFEAFLEHQGDNNYDEVTAIFCHISDVLISNYKAINPVK